MPDLVISEQGIFALLLNLNVKKAIGPDDIPNAFLMRYAGWCAKFLYIIFNISLTQGVLPDDWKIAKVIPVHKSGCKLNAANYRPISLLSTCSKVLEHIIQKHISLHLESNTFSPRNNMVFGMASQR